MLSIFFEQNARSSRVGLPLSKQIKCTRTFFCWFAVIDSGKWCTILVICTSFLFSSPWQLFIWVSKIASIFLYWHNTRQPYIKTILFLISNIKSGDLNNAHVKWNRRLVVSLNIFKLKKKNERQAQNLWFIFICHIWLIAACSNKSMRRWASHRSRRS